MNPPTPQHVRRVPAPPRRDVDAHKGTFGRVLVIGGSVGMAGAPSLVGLAALRSGAGLATLAVPQSIQPTVAGLCPCATTIPLPESRGGDFYPPAAQRALREAGMLTPKPEGQAPEVLVIGPGLGQGSAKLAQQMCELIEDFRRETQAALVVDADALNMMAAADRAGTYSWAERPAPRTILTPHPGELARLLNTSTGEIQADREGHAAVTAQRLRNATPDESEPPVVVLKGAGSIVTEGKRLYVNDTGNPGMATGGSGDVLSGVIAGLVAQGMDCFAAAVTGVYVHGLAGDLAAERHGQIGLIATDIIEALGGAFLRLTCAERRPRSAG